MGIYNPLMDWSLITGWPGGATKWVSDLRVIQLLIALFDYIKIYLYTKTIIFSFVTPLNL